MPAANLLTDEGNIAIQVQNEAVLRTGVQDYGTMSDSDNSDSSCNVHVALLVLVAVGFVLVLRKTGLHGLIVEG